MSEECDRPEVLAYILADTTKTFASRSFGLASDNSYQLHSTFSYVRGSIQMPTTEGRHTASHLVSEATMVLQMISAGRMRREKLDS